jgi:hypothetical protein
MNKRPPLEADWNRIVHPHLHLCQVMKNALEQAKQCRDAKTRKCERYNCTTAIVFCAFTLEAYFNYLGTYLFGDEWDGHLWDKHEEKLNLLSERIGLTIDRNQAPFKTYKEIFNFRDDMAHGKVTDVNAPKPRTWKPNAPPYGLKAHWESMSKLSDATRCVEDTLEMLNIIDEAAGLGGKPCDRRPPPTDGFIGFADWLTKEK